MYSRWLLRAVILAVLAVGAGFDHSPAEAQEHTVGLFSNEEGSSEGYTLFAPLPYKTTYLIDNDGRQVHAWESDYIPGLSAYLLENGNLLRAATPNVNPAFPPFQGAGGLIQEFAWDGTPVWEFEYSSSEHLLHHDIERLPNGNVLMIAWEHKTVEEAVAAGRDPALLADGQLFPDHIIEVEPTGPSGGNIVWEWHVWDHLVQDYDPAKPNYGVVADHPELIDLNYSCSFTCGIGAADWTHTNSVDYNEQFDQILLSVRNLSEVWIIDHSTTTTEAAGHTGGNSGKGGDLLYRWGNPEAYDAGDTNDQVFFVQHHAEWVPPGLPGEGNIMVFNNGLGRPEGWYSSADEIVPPVDAYGNYALTAGQPFGPEELVWTYVAPTPTDFFSEVISGVQRLPNGNTLICEGVKGNLFEVTPDGETVWQYVNPVDETGPVYQGDTPATNWVFRTYRYTSGYPGLLGKDLTPGGTVELYHLDSDSDGLWDEQDNCPFHANPGQEDFDGVIDNGPIVPGDDVTSPSGDNVGDACDEDDDNDGSVDVAEFEDTCPFRLKADSDGDGSLDGYEVNNSSDPCDRASRPPPASLSDSDGDGFSDDAEIRGWGSNPNVIDSDGDVCPDDKEIVDIDGNRRANINDVFWVAKAAFNMIEGNAALDLDKNGSVGVGDAYLAALNSSLVEGTVICP